MFSTPVQPSDRWFPNKNRPCSGRFKVTASGEEFHKWPLRRRPARKRGLGAPNRPGPGRAGAAARARPGAPRAPRALIDPGRFPPCRPRGEPWEGRVGDGEADRSTGWMDGRTDGRGPVGGGGQAGAGGSPGLRPAGGGREARNSRAQLPARSLPRGMFSFLIFLENVFLPTRPSSSLPNPLRRLG